MVVIYLCLQVVYYYKTTLSSSILCKAHCPHGNICGTGSAYVVPSSFTCFKAALMEEYGDTQTIQQILSHQMSHRSPCIECTKHNKMSVVTVQESWLEAPPVFILFFGRERVSLFNPCQGSGFSSFYMLQKLSMK